MANVRGTSASARAASTSGRAANGGGEGRAAATTESTENGLADYEKLGRIGEGTYGVVYRARDKRDGSIVAMKKVRMDRERDGMPITALREVKILQSSRHPNIINLLRVVTGHDWRKVFLVFEYCEHDMSRLLQSMRVPFTEAETKCLIIQLLQAVAFLHRRWVFHRDLKLSNLLLTNRGELKLCDFGLARHHQPGDDGAYTPKVVTLWYRAPELLLGSPKYTAAVDMWAVGCILAELLRHEPLFPGKTEAHVLDLIFNQLGAPNDDIWPGMNSLPRARGLRLPQQPYNYLSEDFGFVGKGGVELINFLLIYDPSARCGAKEALEHPYLTQNAPKPTNKEHMPTFASLHDSLNGVAREDAGDAARGASATKTGAGEKREREEDDGGGRGWFTSDATVGSARRPRR